MVLDEQRSLWDRVRTAWILRRLDPDLAEAHAHEIADLSLADDGATVDDLLSLARTRGEQEPRADLLTAWAHDATRDGGERVQAALALARIDRAEAVALLRSLVGPFRLLNSYSISIADGVHQVTWSTESAQFEAADGMPLYQNEDLMVAAEHLAELDRHTAVAALSDRLVGNTIEPLPPQLVDLLTTLDRPSACEALAHRIRKGFGSAQTEASKLLVQLDPEGAERALAHVARNGSFEESRLEAARLLVDLNPKIAIKTLNRLIKKGFFEESVLDAAELLGGLDPDLMVRALSRRLRKRRFGTSELTQMTGARLLATRAPAHAVKPLSRLAANAFLPFVKIEAQALLAEITAGERKRHGTSPQARNRP
jgi:hypothetical protein